MSRSARAALLLLLAWGLALAEEEGPPLRFDPFREPQGESQNGSAPRAEFTPVLRATLVAGEHSLVDLGGVILGLGEAAHGYRLVAVREHDATFERDGRQLVLEVARESKP